MLHERLVPLVLVLPAFIGACDHSDPEFKIIFDACAPLVLVPEAGTSESEVASTDAAASLWNTAAGTRLTTLESPDAPHLPIHFDPAASAFHGLYDDGRAIVFINEDLHDPHQRAVTIAHEVGHAFGLHHVSRDIRQSLMNTGNLVVEPTATDVDTLAARWGRCGDRP